MRAWSGRGTHRGLTLKGMAQWQPHVRLAGANPDVAEDDVVQQLRRQRRLLLPDHWPLKHGIRSLDLNGDVVHASYRRSWSEEGDPLAAMTCAILEARRDDVMV